MFAILSITFPIFALIALGYGLVRGQLFRPADMGVLGKYVLNLAMPALLFNAVALSPFADVFDPAYLFVYTAGTFGTLLLALAWFSTRGMEKSRIGVAVLGSSMPNSGFIGYPIMLLAHAPVASKVLALNMVVENLLIIPTCLILMELEDGDRKTPLPVFIARTFARLFRRPMMIAIVLGVLVSATGLPLPAAFTRLTTLLAASTAPIALFYIGGTLAGLGAQGNRTIAAQIIAARLFLHPAMILAMLAILPLTGLAPLDPALRAPVILTAAMPMIAIYPILAGEKGHQGMASVAMLGATALSFVTVTALLAVLG